MTERKTLRVGVAQFDGLSGDIAANAASHQRLIDEAGGKLDVLVFPELSLSGYALDVLKDDPARCIVDPDGPELKRVRDACARNQVVVLAGACLRHGHGLGLSTIVIDRQGELCASYDKQHLDGAKQAFFVPGTSGCIIEIEGWRLGLGICYDSSFPEHARGLVLEGAEAYLVSGAFPLGNSDHRRSVYFPARALENTCYLAFANFVGAHGGLKYGGRSALYGPDGHALAEAGPDRTGITLAKFNPDTLRQTRETLEMLHDRRRDRGPARVTRVA